MKILLCITILLSAVTFGWSQSLEMTNSTPIDVNRYKDINGSPYLYEDWRLARIMNNEGQFIVDVLVNFNVETQDFEVTNGTHYILLNENEHGRIEVLDEQTGEYQTFIKSTDYDLASTYAWLHFEGNAIKWLSTFSATLNERKIQTPGKTQVVKSFSLIETNYLIIVDSIIAFKMKEKKILKALANYFPDASKIVNEEQLNIENEDGLRELLFLLDIG